MSVVNFRYYIYNIWPGSVEYNRAESNNPAWGLVLRPLALLPQDGQCQRSAQILSDPWDPVCPTPGFYVPRLWLFFTGSLRLL